MDIAFYLKYLQSRGIKTIPKFIKNEIRHTDKVRVVSSVSTEIPVTQDPKSYIKRSLQEIRDEIGDCKRCRLGELRHNLVFGEGDPDARLMFIGEGPGEEEDKTGRPFVGKAGQLLDRIIEAMHFKREDVFIANIIKCRPPGNRAPMDDEILACKDFIMKQILSIGPKVIVSLGSPATCTLFDRKIKISAIRGGMIDSNTLPHFASFENIKIMPTFHPAYLLRNPQDKRLVWEDMKTVMEYLK